MASCTTSTQNVVAEIKSRCYDNRPNDRYKVIYSYPTEEFGNIVSNALGDTLFIATGESGFLTQDNNQETRTVTIDANDPSGDLINATLDSGGVLAVEYVPFGGSPIPITITMGAGSHTEGTTTYDFTFTDPILEIEVSGTGVTTRTISINMDTQVITVS